jgi:hypothetical protein
VTIAIFSQFFDKHISKIKTSVLGWMKNDDSIIIIIKALKIRQGKREGKYHKKEKLNLQRKKILSPLPKLKLFSMTNWNQVSIRLQSLPTTPDTIFATNCY